jgi:hypothetical protein
MVRLFKVSGNEKIMSQTQKVDPASLRYGLQRKDDTLVILVDLDANCGRYESLQHRIVFEFDSMDAAKRGDAIVSQYGGLSFVAMVEYSPARIETVYYCQEEPPEILYDEMEPIARECFFNPNDTGQFLKNCLLPEEFLRLNISLRALCKSVEAGSSGKVYFVLNKDGTSLDVSALRDRGIEAMVFGEIISVGVQDFGFERLHRLLSCVFVVLEGTEYSIKGIEFDLRK